MTTYKSDKKVEKEIDSKFYAEFRGYPTLTGNLRPKILSLVLSQRREDREYFIKMKIVNRWPNSHTHDCECEECTHTILKSDLSSHLKKQEKE